MKFRVSGCYWSKGQFRNRGINMLGSFLPSRGRQTTTVYSGRGSRHCYAIKSVPVPTWTVTTLIRS